MSWANAVRKPVAKPRPPVVPRPTIMTADIDWARLVTVDFETFYGAGYTLSSMSTSEYVRDPRFKAQMVGVKIGNKPTKVYGPKQLKKALQSINWGTHSVLAHNCAFDSFILSHHYGIKPAKYYDTLSMARGLHSNEVGGSLDDVAKFYGGAGKIDGVLIKTKDVLDWSPELYKEAAIYCTQDVDETYRIFKEMHAIMPAEEMELINMTIRMFCNPVLRVDIPRVQAEYEREVQARKDALLTTINVRDYDNNTTLKTGKERALEGEERDLLIAKRVFGSNESFKQLLLNTGMTEEQIPKKVSPAYIKKSREEKLETPEADKYTYAFAKDDLDFTGLADNVWGLFPGLNSSDPGDVLRAAAKSMLLQQLVDARIATKSTTNITRAERFLEAGKDGMPLPVGYSYYRAHTGRWGGNNKMNMQNLTRGGELRLSILAAAGHQMCVADSGQIEARVNAWLWDEADMLEAFRLGRDIYSEFATEEVYHRIITKADKTERHVGKACIAEGELILTHRGLIPIDRLSLKDRLWDGVEWVRHDGLIDQGIRDVITYDGLTATPDHEVFTEDGRIVSLGQAASEMARLQTTGTGGASVRFCDDHVVTDTPRKRLSVRQGNMRPDRYYQADVAEQLGERKNDIVSEERTQTSPSCRSAGAEVRRDHCAVQQPGAQTLDELRWPGDQVHVQKQDGLRTVGFDKSAAQGLQGRGDRQGQQQRTLRAGESEAGHTQGTDGEPAEYHVGHLERKAGTPGEFPQPAEPQLHSTPGQNRADGRRNHQVRLQIGTGRAQELALNRRQARVYDIANAGPRRRFTASGKLVLNCVLGLGYQMGAPKFQMTLAKGALGGPKVAFSLQHTQSIVNAYRRRYAKIAGGWKICADIIEQMAAGIEGSHKCLRWGNDNGIGYIDLPNGMRLKYPDLKKARGDQGWDEWTYQSGDIRKKIYGGLLTENLVQALARIIVAWQMLQIDKKYPVVMTTHDECVAHPKTREAQKCYDFMIKCMSTPPWWCVDLPLAAEGGWDERYSK